MKSAMSGMITSSSAESWASSRRAMITPPTAMIGARIITLRPITSTCWTCCTSFVLRVMSVGVPKWLVSACEKPCTLLKIARRTSRPNDMAVLDDQ